MSSPAPIHGTAGPDSLSGGIGNDNIYAGAGNDVLIGGDGADNLRGGDGLDHLYGGLGNDALNGDGGADVMEGGLGNDLYVVDDAGDQVIENGGEGYDSVRASVSYALADNLESLELLGNGNINGTGNALDNVLKGNFHDNVLMGLDGADSMNGSDGQDTLIGGAGHDWLQGGNDADSFVLDDWSNFTIVGGKAVSTSSDKITDFQTGVDTIVFNKADYAGLSSGALNSAFFIVGTVANDYHAQFIYDQAHKALYFDPDGYGGQGMVKVADISNGATIAASDIVIYSAPPTQSLTLTFTDTNPPADSAALPTDYHGFSFSSGNDGPYNSTHYAVPNPIYVVNGTAVFDPTSGYHTAGGAVAFTTQQGTELHRTDGSEFIFKGMDITSAWSAGQEVTFHGYLDGYETQTQTIHVTRDAVTHFSVNWLITDLEIEVHSSDGAILQQTVFDNIVTIVSPFP